jgi:Flp pilus assembly pilin Flp
MRKLLALIRGDRFIRNESGAALAELAILIPFLVAMVAGVSELGRLFQTYNTLSKSTRAAARYLSTVPYDDEPVPYITRARNIALCNKQDCTGVPPVVTGLELENIVVTPEFQAGGGGNPITVTLSVTDYNFQPLFNLAALVNVDKWTSVPVRSSTTMYYMWVNAAGAEE